MELRNGFRLEVVILMLCECGLLLVSLFCELKIVALKKRDGFFRFANFVSVKL